MNLGIGGPPKKRGVPPPPFGGGSVGPAAKAAPAFAPKGGADAIGAAGEEEKVAGAGQAGRPAPQGDGIPPEAVCYRSEMETCGSCEYNDAGQCSKLSIPVSDGDGCNLFKGREGQDAEAAEKFEGELEPVAA